MTGVWDSRKLRVSRGLLLHNRPDPIIMLRRLSAIRWMHNWDANILLNRLNHLSGHVCCIVASCEANYVLTMQVAPCLLFGSSHLHSLDLLAQISNMLDLSGNFAITLAPALSVTMPDNRRNLLYLSGKAVGLPLHLNFLAAARHTLR